MTLVDAAQNVILAAAVIVAAGTIWARLLKPALKIGLQDVITEAIAPVAKELQPNGGESLRDQVDRIGRRLDEHMEAEDIQKDLMWSALARAGVVERREGPRRDGS